MFECSLCYKESRDHILICVEEGEAYAAHVLFHEVSGILHLARGAVICRHVPSQKPDACLTRMSGGEVTGGSLSCTQ